MSRTRVAGMAVALTAAAGAAEAQKITEPPATPRVSVAEPAPTGPPRFSTVYGVPSAVPPRSGTVGLGITYATPRNGIQGRDGDGDLGLSYTLGNPVTGVSLTGGLTVSGLDPFGDAGSFSLSASRMLYAGQDTATFASLSASNLGTWGGATGDDVESAVAFTNIGALSLGSTAMPYTVSLGYGQGSQFDSAGTLEDGLFWGLGLGVVPGLSASVSGSETSVNVGATLLVPGLDGLSVTAGVLDAGDQVNRRQTTVTVGYSFEIGG